MKQDIINRTRIALNYFQYKKCNTPILICKTERIIVPEERQYILRMLIRRGNGDYCIPKEIEWCRDIIRAADEHQCSIGIKQAYVYITIRSGVVNSVTDDEWHVDGFSMRITHIPEQNYIWCDRIGTEWLQQSFIIPKGFNPLKHNINNIFQAQAKQECITSTKANRIYMFDPYVVHRRNPSSTGKQRTMVRVSFLPIELMDDGNTPNPLLPCPIYNINGVEDFRNNLL